MLFLRIILTNGGEKNEQFIFGNNVNNRNKLVVPGAQNAPIK